MAHLMNDFHVGVPVEVFDGIVKDPRRWPTFWVAWAWKARATFTAAPALEVTTSFGTSGITVMTAESRLPLPVTARTTVRPSLPGVTWPEESTWATAGSARSTSRPAPSPRPP